MTDDRQSLNSPIAGTSWSRGRVVAYWLTTSVVAYEMVAGSMWNLLRVEYVRVVGAPGLPVLTALHPRRLEAAVCRRVTHPTFSAPQGMGVRGCLRQLFRCGRLPRARWRSTKHVDMGVRIRCCYTRVLGVTPDRAQAPGCTPRNRNAAAGLDRSDARRVLDAGRCPPDASARLTIFLNPRCALTGRD